VTTIMVKDVAGYRAFCAEQNRKVWLGGPRKMADEDLDNPRLWKELDRKRSPSEVNHCLDLLRCALQGADSVQDPRTGERMLPFPPEVKPVFQPTRDPTPMPESEFRSRLTAAPSWVVEAANLAWHFGLRKTETLIVDLRHVDWENECIRLPAEVTKSGKDQALYGGHRGWILVCWLARQARRRGQTRLVMWPGRYWFKKQRRGERVPNEAWQPLTTFRRAWTDTIERAGIERPRRFHDLRAAYITNIARLGSSAITKGLARHASMATTERYIKLVEHQLAEAADRAAKSRPRLKVVR
jgi:integrase